MLSESQEGFRRARDPKMALRSYEGWFESNVELESCMHAAFCLVG